MATIQSSDLDFDTIKTSLKNFFKQKSEFTDYDFEASGISNILDVLAFNTHLNGLVANFGVNESFLSSAQLRSSVVSHAENLGYYPKSKSGSSATITLSVTTDPADTSTASLTLPKFSGFTADVDGTTFTFRTTEVHTAINDGAGTFSFLTSAGSTSIPITEGTLRTKTFLVGETVDSQVYVIPDENIDTTTITVSVFDTPTSSTFTSFTNVNDAIRIDTNSTVFILREVPNGYYELTFSDGTILGKAPEAGNKIVVQYLSTSGADANGASTFSASGISFADDVTGTPNNVLATVSNSAGGSDKETVESIKLNAPIGFATQQRMVTAEDYKATILENFSSVIKDVTAWGGNQNVPAVFGRVYVSLNFKEGITTDTQTETQNAITTNLTDNLAIMSIDTVYVDPITSFLEITTTFNFDPDQTNLTSQATETLIETTIQNFIDENLNTFDSTFRKSNILTKIDALSTAVLNSSMSVKVQQRFSPTINTVADYTVNFPVKIASPDDVNHRVTSSVFTYEGTSALIKNKLNSTILQILNNTTLEVLADNIGTYNETSGVVSLNGFNISALSGDEIKISIVPADENTIRPLRNYIISLDASVSAAKAIIDHQETVSTITS